MTTTAMTMTTANTLEVYRGPSMLDGAPIVALLTGMVKPSRNVKTGPMAQLWILRADLAPHEAVHCGADSSVCGSCPHRGENGKRRSCYVTVHQAPLSVWRGWSKGGAVVVAPSEASNLLSSRGLGLRLGAYGDPAALPMSVVEALISAAPFWTGYTHQWRTCDASLSRFVMASCDTADDYHNATAAGWRTFRVTTPDEQLLAGERECLAETNNMPCSRCRRCKGNTGARLQNITIRAHGAGKGNFAANRSR